MRPVLLELDHVSKVIAGHPVLHDFCLTVCAGEIVALMGPSGSGKSTVLNLAGLLESPTAGRVLVENVVAPTPGSRKATALRRVTLGYLFQNFALIDEATVEENLRVAVAYASTRRNISREMDEALERVGLQGTRKRRAYTLSGGEQQRVAVARLLLKPCVVVLADEPTGSLDSDNAVEILALLRALSDAGKAVLIATHDPEVASRSSRIVQLAGSAVANS